MQPGEEIAFSRHAIDQMREHNLGEEIIRETVWFPDYLRKQADGRMQAIRRVNFNGKEYLLIVIYRNSDDGLRVVTVFRTSKIRKYLAP